MTQRDVDAFVRVLRGRYPSMVFLEDRYYHGGGEGYCLVDRPTGSASRAARLSVYRSVIRRDLS
jgi:hypothetical protein